MNLLLLLVTVLVVSSVSLIGIFFITVKKIKLKKILNSLVAFASGTLLGGAFIHLLPEAYESCNCPSVFYFVLVGIITFFTLEKILYWRHCHDNECDVHAFTHMSIIGDSVHNFIDGIILAAAFAVSTPIGLTTALALIFHEIPQEIGDFAVMIHGGYTKKKALLFNFLSGLAALFGAIVGYFLSEQLASIIPYMLAFAAGGFIYIAGSDLIPELHKTKQIKGSIIQLTFISVGMILMWGLKFIFS